MPSSETYLTGPVPKSQERGESRRSPAPSFDPPRNLFQPPSSPLPKTFRCWENSSGTWGNKMRWAYVVKKGILVWYWKEDSSKWAATTCTNMVSFRAEGSESEQYPVIFVMTYASLFPISGLVPVRTCSRRFRPSANDPWGHGPLLCARDHGPFVFMRNHILSHCRSS